MQLMDMDLDPLEFLTARRRALVGLGVCLAFSAGVLLQAQSSLQGQMQLSAQVSAQTRAGSAAPSTPPVMISLDEAIRRAEINDPTYAGAVASGKTAAYDRGIARSTLLPGVIFHNQALYTQPNGLVNQAGQTGSQAAPIFIANNAVHEYASQAEVTETIGLARIASYQRVDFLAAQAAAEQEIARRGLVATVVNSYYSLLAADQKYTVTERAYDEAQNFDKLTRELEQGREVAHADVLKADLQMQQRSRDRDDARLNAERARLDLAVLLFPDPRTAFALEDGGVQPALPSRGDVEAAAQKNNPQLRSALAAVGASQKEVVAAKAGYLPDVGLAAVYGIDAPQFALSGPLVPGAGQAQNLGYSAAVTLDIPVWDWFATHDRVKQSEIRRQVAVTQLSYTQKRLIAQFNELYSEAVTAHDQLQSLSTSVNTAREGLRLTSLRYKAGESTALEVVDAQNQLTLAESARADGIVRYRMALANLQTLTGTL